MSSVLSPKGKLEFCLGIQSHLEEIGSVRKLMHRLKDQKDVFSLKYGSKPHLDKDDLNEGKDGIRSLAPNIPTPCLFTCFFTYKGILGVRNTDTIRSVVPECLTKIASKSKRFGLNEQPFEEICVDNNLPLILSVEKEYFNFTPDPHFIFTSFLVSLDKKNLKLSSLSTFLAKLHLLWFPYVRSRPAKNSRLRIFTQAGAQQLKKVFILQQRIRTRKIYMGKALERTEKRNHTWVKKTSVIRAKKYEPQKH